MNSGLLIGIEPERRLVGGEGFNAQLAPRQQESNALPAIVN
jgi:hypothetical protein